MQGFTSLALSALLLVSPSFLLAQDTSQPQSNPPKQENPQPQKNPATQANLPNAPSSIITGKPHRQGQIPLEDVPHPPVKLMQTPLNIVGDSYRMFTSPIYIRARRPQVDASYRRRHWRLLVTGHSCRQGHRQPQRRLQQLRQHRLLTISSTATSPVQSPCTEPASSATTTTCAKRVCSPARLKSTPRSSTPSSSWPPSASAPLLPITPASSTRPLPVSIRHSSPATPCSPGPQPRSSPPSIPQPWKQVGIYAGATATALTRVLAEKHFPTDVLLGSAAGWMIGHYVVRAHHRHPIYRHHGNQRL